MRSGAIAAVVVIPWLVPLLAACAARPAVTPATAPGPAEQPRYRGPIIDFHAHFLTAEEQASMAPGTPPGIEHLRGLDDQAGVTRSALIVMARQGDMSATRKLNDGVIAAAAASGGRFFPIGSVHPGDGNDALDELGRIAAAGVRVIKLHPNTQRLDVASPEVAAVTARAAELGLVILFDGFSPFDADQPGKFLKLAITTPKARLILAHIGGPKFDEMALFGMARAFTWYPKNVWFDLSATAHFFAGSPYAPQLLWVTRQIGVDRIVFGSDYPVDEPAHAVDDYARLGYTLDEQRQIFHDNAEALLAPPAR